MIAQVYNEAAPAGFDFQVLEIQMWLAQLNFIEAIFGTARVQLELRDDKSTQDSYLLPDMGKKGTLKHERWFPQGLKQGSTVDLTIDDSYCSRVFFLVKDPISTNPSEDKWDVSEANPEIKQPFSILIHCNLNKIKNLNLGITNNEQIKLGILYALNKIYSIKVNSMSENIDNFWKEFSMTGEINGFGLPPYYCLRLDCDCYYYAFPNNGSLLEYDPSINFTGNPVKVQVGWMPVSIRAVCVAANPVDNQTLDNGDIIPLEYVPNASDGTLLIPYLDGLSLLTSFYVNNEYYDQVYIDVNGNLNISKHGGFGIGDILKFDVRVPQWNML